MSDEDAWLLRYSRHLLLAEWGIEAQRRIDASHVLVVGAGGLGSPAALYLAASGVGRLTLADPDVVDLTNLQRQIALREVDVGANKAQATARNLRALNSCTEIRVCAERLNAVSLSQQLATVQVVLDCSDNFETRHAVNRACVQAGVPLVSGAALRFDAQIAVYDSRNAASPCYACLFPETDSGQLAASEAAEEALEDRCAVMGVFAPLTGIVGATQAAEALKLLAGVGEPLIGQLLLLNGLRMEWQRVEVPRDPLCPICAIRPAARENRSVPCADRRS